MPNMPSADSRCCKDEQDLNSACKGHIVQLKNTLLTQVSSCEIMEYDPEKKKI